MTTRTLLRAGLLVGPLYLTVGVAQGLLREGFDFRRHALSHLANGPWGWVQTANFLVCGLLVVAAAVGLGRALRPQSRAAGWTLGLYGAGMIAASFFCADPVDGFPPGTPEGIPTTMSTSGLLHFACGGIGFLALAATCFVVARAMGARSEAGVARLSVLSGVVVLVGFLGPMFLPGSLGIAGLWVSVVVGWAWLAHVCNRAAAFGG